MPLQLDLAWFGKISEDIRFGKLSGPIWTQKVSIEMMTKGAYLYVRLVLRYSIRANTAVRITVTIADIRYIVRRLMIAISSYNKFLVYVPKVLYILSRQEGSHQPYHSQEHRGHVVKV